MSERDTDRKGLDITFSEASENPFMPNMEKGLSHWFCKLTVDGNEAFDFYFSTSSTERPTRKQVLMRLVEDVEDYRACDGFEDFLALLGQDEEGEEGGSEGLLAWGELGRLSGLVDRYFPENEPSRPSPGI